MYEYQILVNVVVEGESVLYELEELRSIKEIRPGDLIASGSSDIVHEVESVRWYLLDKEECRACVELKDLVLEGDREKWTEDRILSEIGFE